MLPWLHNLTITFRFIIFLKYQLVNFFHIKEYRLVTVYHSIIVSLALRLHRDCLNSRNNLNTNIWFCTWGIVSLISVMLKATHCLVYTHAHIYHENTEAPSIHHSFLNWGIHLLSPRERDSEIAVGGVKLNWGVASIHSMRQIRIILKKTTLAQE